MNPTVCCCFICCACNHASQRRLITTQHAVVPPERNVCGGWIQAGSHCLIPVTLTSSCWFRDYGGKLKVEMKKHQPQVKTEALRLILHALWGWVADTFHPLGLADLNLTPLQGLHLVRLTSVFEWMEVTSILILVSSSSFFWFGSNCAHLTRDQWPVWLVLVRSSAGV